MNNKKLTFAILTFAIVATLLTMYRNPQMMGLRMDSNSMMGGKTSDSMGFNSAMGGVGQRGLAVPEMGVAQDVAYGVAQTERVYSAPMMGGGVTAGMIMPRPYYGEALDVEDRVYDHTAYQGLVVSNFSEYMKQVRDYLQNNGGKILNVSQYTTDDMQYAYLDARIPAEKFEEATSLFSSRAKKVMTESITTQDVTAQQKSMADQLVELEEKKAVKATELAAAPTEAQRQKIQTEIDQINKQIESLTKSKENFTEQVKYATITLTISDSERFFNPQQGASVSDQFRAAVRSLKATTTVLGMFLVWVAVYAVIWLPIIFGVRWVWNKLHRSTVTRK